MKPNLFEIATKELSQDGFLTWLIRYADPEAKEKILPYSSVHRNLCGF